VFLVQLRSFVSKNRVTPTRLFKSQIIILELNI
jgi:hypothetical protein